MRKIGLDYLKLFQRLVLFVSLLLLTGSFALGQTTISLQDFETTPATPTLTFTNTNGGFSTGTNGPAGLPANANLFASGTRGWQLFNNTSTLTFANQSLTGYTNCFVDFRLAGMSVNGTNGIDAADLVTVAISVDGGTTYSNEITIGGAAANQRWDFTATGTSTITYDGNNTPTAVTSASGAGGISTVTINIPNTFTEVRVRIILANNDGNERWVIDNVRIRGTLTCTPPADPTGTITPLANPACGSTTLNFSGAAADIYWQTSASGTSTVNPTTTDLSITSSGTYYARRYDGSCWSLAAVASAAIIVNTAPSITGQPTSPATACGTYSGNLSVTATGTNLNYQWQFSADGSSGWGAVANNTPNAGVTYTNATAATMSIAGLTQTGYYRCVVSNAGCAPATSNVATVTVNPVPATPTGTISPAANPACGSTTLTYSGAAADVYWQTTALGTSTANPTTAGLTVSASGTYYVRRLAGTCWSSASLASAAITINIPVTISTQPANSTVFSGNSASFSVVTSGTVAGFQWQINTGSGWNNLTEAAPYSGTTLSTLTVNPTAVSQDGYQFRCIVVATSPCTNVTSDPAILTVNPAPCGSESFTNMPANNSSYLTRNWTGDNGSTWNATLARTDQQISSSRAICIQRNGVVTSPSIPGGIGSLTFTTRFPFAETRGDLEVRVNGSLVRTVLFAEMNGTTPVTFTVSNINVSGSIVVSFTSTASAGTDSRFAIDNIVWSCYTGCTATQTISGFTPASGPPGTIVTITGTGFTGSTAVKFGSFDAASFTVVDDNTIQATVPANAISGSIGVTNGGCERLSATEFTRLTDNGGCGTGTTGTNLIISEVFDSNTGSLGYIEIFNPTGGSINLSGYYLRINTGAITNLPNFSSFSLASGAVAVIRIGDPTVSGTTLCPGVTLQQTFDGAPGFNTSDEIALMQGTSGSGSVVDVVNTPSSGNGFSQLRNATALTPRTTYQPSEWTNADLESCGHLGTAPTAITTTNVSINTQPADVNCAAVTFSVAATGTPAINPTSGYTWRYHAPGATGWSLVSSLNGSNGITVTGSGTASITIAGNTAILKDYQFYVDISTGSPSCVKASDAAQFNYDSRPYYRSVSSGLWTNPATWEMSNAEGGPYVTACEYPVDVNSLKVNILNGHTVTLETIDVIIDWVNINTGGTLTINNTSLLTFNNGNTGGADLEVNGTLIDNASNTNGVDFVAGTWQLGAAATIIRSNTSSASVYRDNYQGGMSTIPATANWIIRGSSSINVPFTTTGGTFYPNLTFESTSGTWNPSSATTNSRFTGSTGGFATVKGNLDIGGAGAGTVVVYSENTNATPLRVLGNLLVRTNNTLTNNGNNSGTGFEVQGNVTVNGTLTITGTTGTNGLLLLSGTNPQSVSGTGTINLQDVTINNSSTGAGGGVTLNRALGMNGVLTLTNGLVNTTSTNLLSLTADATNPAGGSAASFINGPMSKAGTAAFTFPVGTNSPGVNHYRTISISAGASNTYTAQFYRADGFSLWGGISNPARLAGLQRISRCEYWDLIKNPGPGSNDRAVTLTWSTQSGCEPGVPYVVTPGALVVVQHNGTQWGDTFGSDGGFTGDATGGSVTWTAASLYTRFVLGSISALLNPLPFDLTVFNATGKNKQVQLDWTVNNNQQIKEYTLERSRDGQRFQFFKTVSARVQEQRASYTDQDPAPFAGWNYYRLRAVTHSGEVYYSETRKVKMGQQAEIGISPNPAQNILTIRLPGAASVTELTISNSVGQVLRQLKRTADVLTVDLSAWPSGVYYVRLITADGMVVKPFVKE